MRTQILSFGFSDMEAIGYPSKNHFGSGLYWGQKSSCRGLKNIREKTWDRVAPPGQIWPQREERIAGEGNEDQGEFLFVMKNTLLCLHGLWGAGSRGLEIQERSR